MANTNDLEPIEATLCVNATPAQVYRALTSQNELRKWWAPRVIMSRNLVSQEQDRMVEMRLMQSDRNQLVRYSWRGQDWSGDAEPTTITFRISDLGASRHRTGEGLMLEISHDGWTNARERQRQKKIWDRALPVLEGLLSGKKVRPWWGKESGRLTFQQVRLTTLKPFFESIGKRSISRTLWKICSSLDSEGRWYLHDGEEEFEFRSGSCRVFGLDRDGVVKIFWIDLSGALGANLEEFMRRFSVEQEVDVDEDTASTIQTMRVEDVRAELWIRWCSDVLDIIEAPV